MGIFKFFIKTVTNYVDEAVMAYIFIQGNDAAVVGSGKTVEKDT